MAEPPADGLREADFEPRRRNRALRELRGPHYAAVRASWRAARSRFDAESAALLLALRRYARDGRAREVPVSTLLTGLDALVRPACGGDGALDFGRVREWAGTAVIRAYYGDG